jgi:hypothetical protein
MADELNNKKNIDDSKQSLNDFNAALKESVDLSKQLAKAVSSIPAELKLSESKNKNLVRGAQDYNKLLNDTLKLSDKIAKGKAKEKEVQDQINAISKEGKKFAEENASSFGKGGRFLLKQKELQKDINFLQATQLKRQGDLEEAVNKIKQIEDQIATQKERSLINSQEKRLANARIKELKGDLKNQEKTARALDDMIKSEEKRLSIKAKEKKTVDNSIGSYKDLISLFDKLLLLAKDIEGTVKETTFDKLRSGDFKKQAEGIKELFSFASGLGAAFKPVLDFAFKISSQTTQLQKNLVLSQSEARNLRQDFNAIAVSSNDIAITTDRLVEANTALGKQLGFSSEFTEDLNKQFVKLTKQLGLSEEAAGGLAKLSIATGATLEDTKNIAYETTQGLSSQYGIQLNQREVLEEIGKLSGQTLAMFKANPKALAEAVAQAKLLGTTLDQTKKQASSLLNFETSIENELQAELLTGQQLNLERARTAALMGDQTTVMKELANQNIDFNKFSNMNVIAQDKVAAALGLSSDELSDQLLKQQYLGKSREEIAALAGEEVANRVEAISAQDKFNLAVEKMQDIIGKIVGGPLGKFIDGMASLVESSTVLYSILGAMAGISLVKLISSIVTMSASLAASGVAAGALTAFLNPVNLLIGIAALAGIGALIGSAMSDASEAATPMANGGLLYGPTNILAGEYSGAENNPEVIAPLSDLQDIISNTNRQTVVAQDNSEMLSKFDALISKMENVSSGIGKLNNKEGKVLINGQAAGTAQMMGNYNLA